jgi:uncharacterized protein (TIGR03663 family)
MGSKTKKPQNAKTEAEIETVALDTETVTEQTEARGFDAVWFAASGVIIAVSAFLRFYWLELKPFHHDEGVNGFFLTTLFRDGTYHYDPANYHGPTLYYITLAFTKVFGLSTIPVRSSVAIFGVLTVILVLFLRRYLGRIGSLAAATFVALSPGMVYISRYFIHEIFFVFCSLAVVVAVVFFIEKRKAGPFSIFWFALILLVCFLPSAMNLATTIGGQNTGVLWALRIGFIIVELTIVFFIIRMLLSWDGGRPVYLLLASASAALMFATKETTFITLGTMLIACASVWVWRGIALSDGFRRHLFGVIIGFLIVVLAALLLNLNAANDGIKFLTNFFIGDGQTQETFAFYTLIVLTVLTVAAWIRFLSGSIRSNETTLAEPAKLTWKNFREGMGGGTDLLLLVTALAAIFIYLNIVFFSSFFSYKEGVGKAFEAYTIWSKTGNKEHTQNGMLAYLKWGMKVESPLLLLSSFGAVVALIRAKHRFAVFTAFWAFGLFAAYTLIPYKTPWLALSFYLPMCLIAGYGINELAGVKNIWSKVLAGALAAVAALMLAYQAYDLSFVRYDDEEMGYVYAHTKRPFMEMIDKINYYADKSGMGRATAIEVVSPDYWPMPWYTNDYPNANYHGVMVDANSSEMIVAKKNDQDAEVVKRFASHYKLDGIYPLRPGVELMLLVRKDIADPQTIDLYKLPEIDTK